MSKVQALYIQDYHSLHLGGGLSRDLHVVAACHAAPITASTNLMWNHLSTTPKRCSCMDANTKGHQWWIYIKVQPDLSHWFDLCGHQLSTQIDRSLIWQRVWARKLTWLLAACYCCACYFRGTNCWRMYIYWCCFNKLYRVLISRE